MTVAPSVSLAAITSNRRSVQLSPELSLTIQFSLCNVTTRILALGFKHEYGFEFYENPPLTNLLLLNSVYSTLKISQGLRPCLTHHFRHKKRVIRFLSETWKIRAKQDLMLTMRHLPEFTGDIWASWLLVTHIRHSIKVAEGRKAHGMLGWKTRCEVWVVWQKCGGRLQGWRFHTSTDAGE